MENKIRVKGFTLIEVIATLAILGILAASVSAGITDMRKGAVEAIAADAANELSSREKQAWAEYVAGGGNLQLGYNPPDTQLNGGFGDDWIAAGETVEFRGFTIGFNRYCGEQYEPCTWTATVY